jgi:hypothetical protein
MQPRQTWHPKITDAAILRACEHYSTTLDNSGFCIASGHAADACDPDTRGAACESCGERKVYGAQELAMHLGEDGK